MMLFNLDAARQQRLADNLSLLPRRLSAWMMGAGMFLGLLWDHLSQEDRLTLLQHSPLPAWAYPIVLTAVGLISSIWPRKNKVSPDEAAAPTPIEIPTMKDRSE